MLLLCFFLALPLTQSLAQYDNLFFQLKPAAQKGVLLYQSGAYEKAIPFLQQAIKQRGANKQLKLMLAHAYAVSGQAQEAVKLYQQSSRQELETRHLLAYSRSLQALGRSEEANAVYQQYLKQIENKGDLNPSLDPIELHRAAIRYSVHPLSINTRYNEFAPILLNEGLLFLSDRKKGALVRRSYSSHITDLDLYEASARSNTRFVNVTNLGGNLNSPLHEGPAAVDTLGNIWFSRSDRNGRIRLWKAAAGEAPGQWASAEQLNIAAEGNLFHPAISADGELLFFVSDMPGGYGGTDIYYSRLQEEGWSVPVNAGPKINSAGSESFPTLREHKLYFSSDGRGGLGGLDIYEAHLSGLRVIQVRNLGSPMNSPGDDFGLVWLKDGSGGYFASNRRGSRGGDDLFRLDYHVINLNGVLRDSTNYKPLAGAKVTLQLPDGGQREAISNEQGGYSFTLFPGEIYKLTFEAKNYRPRTLSYTTLQGKQYGKRNFDLALERKTKVFVLGTAKLPDNRRAAHAQILVYDQAGGKPDTVLANERGSYEIELDTQSKYSFLLSCDNWGNVAEFQTSERSEASLSHYLNVSLKPQLAYTVTGQIEGADPTKPLVIWLTNSLNGEATMLWPEGNSFSFAATSLVSYELCVQQDGKSANLHLGSEWQKEQRKVVLQLK